MKKVRQRKLPGEGVLRAESENRMELSQEERSFQTVCRRGRRSNLSLAGVEERGQRWAWRNSMSGIRRNDLG